MNTAKITNMLSNILTKAERDIGIILELSILALVGIGFALPFLDMNSNFTLPGTELQAHIGHIQLFIDWFDGKANFPLWNPAFGLGRSLIADPFLFAFNPFASIPMWFWGLNNGSKIAISINFLVAGFGMWSVAKLLGFRWPTRLWASMLYMVSGGLVSHLMVGQLQLVFALGWLPWSFAGLLWVWQKKSYTSAALASLPQALFFFSGNLYYQVYAVFCYIVILIVLSVEWHPVKIDISGLWKISVMGLLTLGLISIQLLPAFAARKDISNQGGYTQDEQEFYGSQKPVYALLNYIIAEREFTESPTLGKIPYIQESYRYIGISPFLFLLLIIPAFKRSKHKREIIALALSFILLLCWTGVKYTFFKDLYHNLPYLYQFRFPGRALSAGAMFLILLGGYGLEEILTWINSLTKGLFVKEEDSDAHFPVFAGRTFLFGLVLIGLGFAVRDVSVSNSQIAELEATPMLNAEEGFRWLRAQENGAYTFGIYATDAIVVRRSNDAYSKQFRIMNLFDGWTPTGTEIHIGKYEAVTIEPKYWLLWEVDPMDQPEATLIHKLGALEIWETQAFPFAFTVPVGRFDIEPYEIRPSEVQPVLSYVRQGPNRIQVETNTNEATVLVVSEAWFSGWTVKIDGDRADTSSVSNLLAIPLPAGQHTVNFEYAPPAFRVGVTLSLITLVAIVVIPVFEFARRKRKSISQPA